MVVAGIIMIGSVVLVGLCFALSKMKLQNHRRKVVYISHGSNGLQGATNDIKKQVV